MSESANTYQAHNDPVDPGSDDGEEALDNEDLRGKRHKMLLWTMLLFSRQLNWTRLLFSLIHGTMILFPR